MMVALHAGLVSALAVLVPVLPAAQESPVRSDRDTDSLTFTGDVAPIIFAHCSSCHRPGRPAPFNLLTYGDVASRAPLIAQVVEDRNMPPWLPARGYVAFAGERSLSDEQIAVIRRWVDGGAIEGDPADLPAVPEWGGAWQLGVPDLVVRLPAYTAPAQGRDVYRNLVASIPITDRRYVSSVELRWGETRVVHHARMMVDTTESSRFFDAQDPAAGFDGMDLISAADNPPGHFVGWAPGRIQARGADDLAWPLSPGTDVVLQLHLRPTGRVETVTPEVGFYFSPRPPTRTPALVMLGSYDIDIPPGETEYLVTDTYELPVDVEALGVYPHAHYLGKQIWGTAVLPDGSMKWLLRVDQWDFNSQDDYRYQEPIFLPAGTTLSMRWVYDNSSNNPFNPNQPPRRVTYGSLSSDEMSDLVVQVLPRNPQDLDRLNRDLAWKYEQREVIYLAARERSAGDSLAAEGRYDAAISRYQEALRLRTDDPTVLLSLAVALAANGDAESSVFVAERAAELTEFSDAVILDGLASAYAAAGQLDRAVTTAERAIAVAAEAGMDELAQAIRRRLTRYRQRQSARRHPSIGGCCDTQDTGY